MKCEICKAKKGKRLCLRVNTYICSQCCGCTRNILVCNSLCNYFSKENYFLLPTGSLKLTENGRGKVIKFSESLFLPNIYELLAFEIEELIISIKNPILLSVNLSFSIREKRKVMRDVSLDECYHIDSWKRQNYNKLPFMQIYTLGNGEIDNFCLERINDKIKEDILVENNHAETWLPFSKIIKEKIFKKDFDNDPIIQDGQLSDIGYGKFLFGKNNTLFSSLKINEKYNLKFDMYYKSIISDKDNIVIPLGFFFPFSLVNYSHYSIKMLDEYKFADKTEIQLLLPFEDKAIMNFPKPLENCNTISSPKYVSHKISNIENTFHYDKYCIFNHFFSIKSKNNSIANAFFPKIPIFTGIYDDFNKVFEKDYAPVKITIFNSSNTIKKYNIFVQIKDLSFSYEDEVYVEANSVANFSIAPQLKTDKINKITTTTRKNIEVKVKENNRIIFNKNNSCIIYPKDNFIERISNDRLDWEIDFRSFIARWITPNAKEIDKIVSEVALNGNIVSNKSNNSYLIENEIKCVFDSLSKINYSIRTTTFSENDYHIQRLSLPKTVMKYKSGNCIDLSILLASVFEALKLNTYICLIPGHAFVRVKINDYQYCNIESTFLGEKEFSEAVEKANELYDKYFINNQPKDFESCYIVDVALARKSKIFPME